MAVCFILVNPSFFKQRLLCALKKQLLFSAIIFSFIISRSFLQLQAQQTDTVYKILNAPVSRAKKLATLAKYSMELSGSNADSAMLLAKECMQQAIKFKNDTSLAYCCGSAGFCYYILGNRDSAEYYSLKAVSIFKKQKDSVNEAKCLLNLSYAYQDGQEYVKLLNCLKRARPLFEKKKDEAGLASVDLTIGSTYGDMQLYEQGKQYIRTAIATILRIKKTDFLTSCYSGYGYLFMQQNNFDSALYYYRLEYAWGKRLDDLQSKAYATDNLGEVFLKKYTETNCKVCIDSAFYYYHLALNLFGKMDSPSAIKYAEMNLGGILRIKNQYKDSEKFLADAFHYFDSTGDIKYAYDASQHLSMLYADMGDYKQAYKYNITSQKFKDSLDTKNRTGSIAKMFAQYETEKKDRAIQLLNAQAKLNEKEISNQHIVEIFSLISVVLAVILLIVLLNRNRMKQQLKEVKVRNQLAGDLHDEVGSSLSSILLLSKMASGKIPRETVDKNLLETIADNTKEVIDKMGDIVWMMNPKYDEGGNLREKLEQYILRVKEIAPFEIHFNSPEGIDNIKFTMELRKSIFLIFKEAINNALKYSQATELNISLTMVDKNIQLIIEDNGKGFDKATVIAGNGLETMALRTQDCKGNFNIWSAPCKGTQVKVIIPIPHIR
jgi:two-component system sensor histidine kinase UhpB